MNTAAKRTSSALALTVALALTAVAAFAGSPAWADDTEDRQQTDPANIALVAADVNREYLETQASGETSLASSLDLSYLADSFAGQSAKNARIALPHAFDLRSQGKVSSVKNQNPYGSCWAFAATASLESTLLPHVPETSLSPWHLAWFGYYGTDEREVSPVFGAGPLGYAYDQGGYDTQAIASLAAWKGPIAFDKAPHATMFAESQRFDADYHLQQAYCLPTSYADAAYATKQLGLEQVKEILHNKGAITAHYAYDQRYESLDRRAFFRADKATVSHAVTIVGWDDDYGKENFTGAAQPTENGAWLIKNSWGTGDYALYGDAGYFWMSYEDASLRYGALYEAGPADDYTRNHQYDTAGWMASIGIEGAGTTAYAANVFSTADAAEELQAVSLYTTDNNATYTIMVYTGMEDPHNPTTGTLAFTQTGTEQYAGYHQIPLDQGVEVGAHTKFAVVVKFENPEYAFPLPVEARLSPGNKGELKHVGFDDEGNREPSLVSADGQSWRDPMEWLVDSRNTYIGVANVCIKAFTNPPGTSPRTLPEETDKALLTDLVVEKTTGSPWPYSSFEQIKLALGVRDYAINLTSEQEAVAVRFSGLPEAQLSAGTEDPSTLAGNTFSAKMSLALGESKDLVLACPQPSGEQILYTLHVSRESAEGKVFLNRYDETIEYDSAAFDLLAPDGSGILSLSSITSYLPAPGDPATELRLVAKGTTEPVLRSIPLEARPEKPQEPTLDYQAEALGTHYDSTVALSTSPDRSNADARIYGVSYKTRVEPGRTYYLWKESTNTHFASETLEVSLPARPAAPTASELPRVVERTRFSIGFEKILGMQYATEDTTPNYNTRFTFITPGEKVFFVNWGADQAGKRFASSPSQALRESTLAYDLPVSYHAVSEGKASPIVHDRGRWTTDWAFATLGALESSRLTQGFASDGIDLSEASLVSHTFNHRPTSEHDASAPGYYTQADPSPGETESLGFTTPGSWKMAVSTLARWQGPVNETSDPYRSKSSADAQFMDEAAGKTSGQSTFRLASAQVLPTLVEKTTEGWTAAAQGKDALKDAVLTSGSALVSMYAPENGGPYVGAGEAGAHPNKTHYTYDATKKGLSATTTLQVVGWDDAYARTNFTVVDEQGVDHAPYEDGAWILKGSEGPEFADGGYVWVSYAEPTLTSPLLLRAEACPEGTHEYARNYQFDSIYPQTLSGFMDDASMAGANVFTAQEDETLDGVGLWVGTAGTNVHVSVYRQLTDNANPESGTLVENAVTETVLDEGYATVALSAKVPLAKGESFSLVVEQTPPRGGRSVMLESSHTNNDAVPAIEPGQSFVRENGMWRDAADSQSQKDWAFRMKVGSVGNVAAKALANPLTQPSPNPPPSDEPSTPKTLSPTGDRTLVPLQASLVVASLAALLATSARKTERNRRRG